MARSDSFFLRQTLNADNTGTFQETPLDLGAYVDALGKSVLRVHNVAVTFSDVNGKELTLTQPSAFAQFQLTTQSQTDVVSSSNRSIVASGSLYMVNAIASQQMPAVYHDADVLPQHWTNGYLIAVDSMFLGGRAISTDQDVHISVTMECTVEKMSEAAAMALALSQQGA